MISRLPLLESSHSIVSLDGATPKLALESAFARYVSYWDVTPTIDATANALHCLRVLKRLREFMVRERSSILTFLSGCACPDGGFGLSPALRDAPSLYATVSAFGVLKALAEQPQSDPLCKKESEIADEIGRGLFHELRESAEDFTRRCAFEGAFRDSPAETEATLHSLDLGISALWNLGIGLESIPGVSEKTVLEFIESCKVTIEIPAVGEAVGFATAPGLKRPCVTTTSLTERIFSRGMPSAMYPYEKEIQRFFGSMEEEGGVRVFPEQPASLSATAYAVHAVTRLRDRTWLTEERKGRLLTFVAE